jgi:hypothetical protein
MLTDQSIEAELSYAYLHAVAPRAGGQVSGWPGGWPGVWNEWHCHELSWLQR